MTSFDPDKPVQTRDGKPARIICKDALGKPIVALVRLPDDSELALSYHPDGWLYSNDEDPDDLINVPLHVERSEWYIVYPHTIGCDYWSREELDKSFKNSVGDGVTVLRVDRLSDGTRTYTEEPK